MNLKPWREIARPHKDVLEGTFKQAEFAADITQVANGKAPSEYQDAEKFYSRTYITEGLRLLLISVARRLAGLGGDPVIQLQTAFGGGKTHALLAVYHLASRKVGTHKLAGIPPVLDDAGISSLPQAKVAVIDGVRLSPSQPKKYGSVTANTLWGELAWQLLGKAGYDKVAQADQDGTSPGKEVLTELIDMAAPCVILIDELVAFNRQLELGERFKAGTFDSNISFIQALTEAMKAVPNAILLATLPESQLEAGGTMGQRALNSLEEYFARVESVWKPVGTEEAFEIVRRRLFETPGERAEVEGVSRQFFDFYRQHAGKFPVETQSNEYLERLCRSYPIHPEIFDRLYEDWATLEKFQRTRGVLQYMAIVIHRLWNSDNRDALIMPGSLPLEDSNVRSKSIHYLSHGWESIIEREVDGTRSAPYKIDGHLTTFGGVQAARRTTRTIFLGSAPSVREQAVRGVQVERILLGAAQPGQPLGVFEDVLKRLRDCLHHLYSGQDRYWLDTNPNLRREMDMRRRNISELDDLLPLLKARVSQEFGRNHRFGGIHVFTQSVDIPDDGSVPRLVVLPTNSAYSSTESNQAFTAAEKILRNRGALPRQKQNRLIFLAADFDVIGRLKEQGRVFLAWKSIVIDIENELLTHDLAHLNQAKRDRDGAEQSLSQLVRETYKWLVAPDQEFVKGVLTQSWGAVSVSPAAPDLIQAIEEKLSEEEWMIYEWSPIHLRNMLNEWYFKDGVTEVSALKVWHDTCHHLYLPRLANVNVFRDAINQGVKGEDYFAFASGKEGDRYLGFCFGLSPIAALDEFSLLIDREAAVAYRERTQQVTQPQTGTGGVYGADGDVVTSASVTGDAVAATHILGQTEEVGTTDPSSTKKLFYSNVSLDPVKAKIDFATIVDEVVQQFTTKQGVDVKISVEIIAETKVGFDEGLRRSVKENCKVLKFVNAEFEEGE